MGSCVRPRPTEVCEAGILLPMNENLVSSHRRTLARVWRFELRDQSSSCWDRSQTSWTWKKGTWTGFMPSECENASSSTNEKITHVFPQHLWFLENICQIKSNLDIMYFFLNIYKKGNEPTTDLSGWQVRNLLLFCGAAGRAAAQCQRAAGWTQPPFNYNINSIHWSA